MYRPKKRLLKTIAKWLANAIQLAVILVFVPWLAFNGVYALFGLRLFYDLPTVAAFWATWVSFLVPTMYFRKLTKGDKQ